MHGVDNNQRAVFFGPQGDTRWNQQRLERELPSYRHHELDIRDREGVLDLIAGLKPSLIVHAAAQPSHDRAAAIPFDDFDTNAVGTLNFLEAARRSCPESPFVYMSTNKVYGDGPNRIALVEQDTRWDYADPAYAERHPGDVLDRSEPAQPVRREQGGGRCDGAGVRPLLRHADLLPARRLSDRTESQRRRAARLSQLSRPVQPRRARLHDFRLQGQTGPRQHPQPRRGAFHPRLRRRSPQRRGLQPWRRQSQFLQHARSVLRWWSRSRGSGSDSHYVDTNRIGDHICYYSDLRKMRAHYPGWNITVSLHQTVNEIVAAWRQKLVS